MTAKCYTTVKSKIVRLTRTNPCGVPLVGPKSTLVSGGFTKVVSKWDIEDGEKFEQRNAWGDYCVNERDDPRIKGGDIEIEFCRVDPDAYDLVSGARVIAATAAETFAAVGQSIGYAIGRDTIPGGFALETWTKLGGGACGAGGLPIWAYSVWPYLTGGRPGDQTLDRGTTTFPQSAYANPAPPEWGDGPYANPVTTLAPGEVFAQVLTAVQPPVDACGAFALAAA